MTRRILPTAALLLLLAACSSAPSSPTPDPTQAQAPSADADAAADGTDAAAIEELGEQDGIRALRVAGVTVLHKQTKANEVVSAQLYFIGGTRRLDLSTGGIEEFALATSTSGGTLSTPKDAFNAQLDAMGASIGSFTDRDYSGIALKTISPYFDQVWTLFSQVITEPAIPPSEVELFRSRQLARIDSMLENPDTHVSHLATQLLFENHPYATLQLGTRPVVEQLEREALLSWQKRLLDPKNMLLVVVGNVSTEVVAQKALATFGALPTSQKPPLPPLPPLAAAGPKFTFAKAPLPTNYIFGLFKAPAPGSEDYAPMVVAMDYLSDRLFEEVRSKRKLTYAVSAGLSDRQANYGYLYVTATDPKQTLQVIFEEIDALKATPMADQTIKETLNVFLTNHYMSQETNSGQAADLAEAYILTGDWRHALTFLDELQAVTPEKVKRVLETYMKNYHFAVVGPDQEVLPKALMRR